jgi:hypothetical protein
MSLTINPVEGQMEWRVKENKVIEDQERPSGRWMTAP